MKLLESQILPGARGWPGSVSSSPVENTATRGRGKTSARARPDEASTAICIGPSRVPRASSTSPSRASPPLYRTAWPGSTASRIATWAMPPSVSSTGTMASAPPGSLAPVVIRRQLPGVTA